MKQKEKDDTKFFMKIAAGEMKKQRESDDIVQEREKILKRSEEERL